jgi:two-component system phosphate regulon sensor histidine kinase PhoR
MPAYVREKAKDWSDYRTKEVEQTQAQSKFRQQFVGNVAHELKTPIFTIEGFIDTLLDGAKEDPELCDKFLKKAAKNAMRMRLIVEDLDAIWRLESGVLGLRMEEFDIVELVQDNMEAIEAKAKRTNHKLALSDDSVDEAMVSGDEGQIAQVITNLLVNSINYGRMENGLTTVRVFHEDERVHVEVKDNGIGIELRHQSRIFERFYRVDKSRSRQDGGSGLGLSIIKHIIDAHGEKIWVESLAGEGSSFTFTLKEP